MGQYFVVANPDKRQFIKPGWFWNDKLHGVLEGVPASVLSLLIADGGFDRGPTGLVGSWVGDRVVLAGDDYGVPGAAGHDTVSHGDPSRNLSQLAHEEYLDLTLPAIVMLADFDDWYAGDLAEIALREPPSDLLWVCGFLAREGYSSSLSSALNAANPLWQGMWAAEDAGYPGDSPRTRPVWPAAFPRPTSAG